MRTSAEHIRDAALRKFAAQGTERTSLRAVAAAAGVSLGRVQHHFGTKARLIEAVDAYVLGVLRADLPGPTSPAHADPVGEFGNRVVALIGEHPDIVNYLGRALVDGSEFGAVVFDNLVTRGEGRWEQLVQRQLARPDVDLPWAAMNPIILALGAVLLRTHIDRHLPESFTAPTQLHRWERAVSALIREGQLRRGGTHDEQD